MDPNFPTKMLVTFSAWPSSRCNGSSTSGRKVRILPSRVDQAGGILLTGLHVNSTADVLCVASVHL